MTDLTDQQIEEMTEVMRGNLRTTLESTHAFIMFESVEDESGKLVFNDAILTFIPGIVFYQIMKTTIRIENHKAGGTSEKPLHQTLRSMFADSSDFYSYVQTCFLTYRELFPEFSVVRVSRDATFDFQMFCSEFWRLQLKTNAQRAGKQPYPLVPALPGEEHLPGYWDGGLLLTGEERSKCLDKHIAQAFLYFNEEEELVDEKMSQRMLKAEDAHRDEMRGA